MNFALTLDAFAILQVHQRPVKIAAQFLRMHEFNKTTWNRFTHEVQSRT